MCGRFTNKLTWAEIVALYRLALPAPPHNMPPRYNICPTDPVDLVIERDGKRDLVRMRWGLIPRWWSKPLKKAKMATFNARAETVETKPFFRDAFKRTRCLIPMSGYYEWQATAAGKQPWYFTTNRISAKCKRGQLCENEAVPFEGSPMGAAYEGGPSARTGSCVRIRGN